MLQYHNLCLDYIFSSGQSCLITYFINTILWGNEVKLYSKGNEAWIDYKSNPSFINCVIKEGINGIGVNAFNGVYENCLDTAPLFASPSAGAGMGYDGTTANWRLQAGSPCINSGSNATVPADIDTDLAGNPRINNGVVDMGAYEF